MHGEQGIVVCAYHNVGDDCLTELLCQGARVSLVFTHEDNPGEEIWFGSVRELARQHGIPCLTSDINLPDNIGLIRDLAPQFLFSFYYRNMIRPEILDIPQRGALNMHGSLLPRYRGRVPVNWAVINGETETGATLHYMVEKPDAGDLVDQEAVPILINDTARQVFDKVCAAAVSIIRRSWPQLREGTAPRTPQNLAAGSYFGGRCPADGIIDWTRSAVAIHNLVRGVTHPYPGAFTHLHGRRLFIWDVWPVGGMADPGAVISTDPLLVGTGEGLLEIRSLQLEGEEEQPGPLFTSQHPLDGTIFSP